MAKRRSLFLSKDRETHISERGQTLDEVAKWTEGMLWLSAVDTVIQKLQKNRNWVTITGNAGEGKTSVGHMVLETLKGEGQTVFKIDKPEEYYLVKKMAKNCVIMLDDVLGEFTFDPSKLNTWKSVIQDVLSNNNPTDQTLQTSVIFIIRSNILDEARYHLDVNLNRILDLYYGVDLSQTGTGTPHERLGILDHYLNARNVSVSTLVKEMICCRKMSHGFPHCCKLYTELPQLKEIAIEDFFARPIKFLDDATDVMIQNHNITTLLNAMIISDGRLDGDSITDRQQREDMQAAMSQLIHTYVKKTSNGIIMFSHPSVYESVANTICERNQIFFVENASLSILRQKVNIKEPDQDTLGGFINVDPCPVTIEILTRRFHLDLLDKDFSVFKISRLCKNAEFCQSLVKRSTYNSLSSDMADKKDMIYIDDRDTSGNTMLHTAAINGNYTAVRILLEQGADVNKVIENSDKQSVLQIACERNPLRIEHVTLLLQHGADVNKAYGTGTTSDGGKTALHYLCHSTHPDISAIEFLFKQGADVNRPTLDGRTVLHKLCCSDKPNVEVVGLLIKNGADVNKSDSTGQAALHLLFHSDKPNINVIGLLMDHGADVNKGDDNGLTALHWLSNTYQPTVSVMELLITHGADLEKGDNGGKTALHYQCIKGRPDFSVIELLINNGVDVNKATDDGRTALHFLIYSGKPQVTIVELLIQNGADVNKGDRDGWTVLHKLCNMGQRYIGLIEVLIELGADVNRADTNGNTPLHYLCIRGKPVLSVIDLLIKYDVELNKADGKGMTALHKLCDRGQQHANVIQVLIKHGADVNIADACGRTALHWLCNNQRPPISIIELLIAHGAELNRTDDNGWTALHWMCFRGHPDTRVIEMFIKSGISVNKTTNKGMTELDLLFTRRHPDGDVIEVLVKHGAIVNRAASKRKTALHKTARQ